MNNKDEIIHSLSEARQKILQVAAAVPPERRDEVFLGEWSVRDLLAHLEGWDYANADAVFDIRSGQNPRLFKHWNPDWTQFNARLVRQYKLEDWDEFIATLDESHAALMRLLNSVPPEEYQKDFGARNSRGRIVTIAVHLQAEIEDENEHYQQLEEWSKGWAQNG